MDKTLTFEKSKFKNLDFLRGVAALLVSLCHFAPYGGYTMPSATGGLCVGFFFILSAFVLCHAYESQINIKKLSFKTYLGFRVARLFPLHFLTFFIVLLYWALVSLAIFYGIPLNTTNDWNPLKIVENLTMTHLLITGENSYNSPAWSISVEFWCSLYVFALCFPIRNSIKILLIVITFIGYMAVLNIVGFIGAKDQCADGCFEKN